MRARCLPFTLPLLAAMVLLALAPYCAPPVACSLAEASAAMRGVGCCPMNVSCCPPLRSMAIAPMANPPSVDAPLERVDLASLDLAPIARLAVVIAPTAVARAPGLPSVLRI